MTKNKTNTAAKTKVTKIVDKESGLVIETGIPIPEGRQKNPFTIAAKKMSVGQSVLVDKAPKGLYNLQKKLGMKFSTAKEGLKTRIWRKS